MASKANDFTLVFEKWSTSNMQKAFSKSISYSTSFFPHLCCTMWHWSCHTWDYLWAVANMWFTSLLSSCGLQHLGLFSTYSSCSTRNYLGFYFTVHFICTFYALCLPFECLVCTSSNFPASGPWLPQWFFCFYMSFGGQEALPFIAGCGSQSGNHAWFFF